MTYQKIAAAAQHRQHACDYLLFSFHIEINHDIAQKYHVEFTELRQCRVEINLQELHARAQFLVDQKCSLLRADTFETVAAKITARNIFGALDQSLLSRGVGSGVLDQLKDGGRVSNRGCGAQEFKGRRRDSPALGFGFVDPPSKL